MIHKHDRNVPSDTYMTLNIDLNIRKKTEQQSIHVSFLYLVI